LIALKGKLKNIKKSNNVKGLVFSERTKHSKKPDCVRDRIVELCRDLPRIELFARDKNIFSQGWDVWGNEV
jgi:N6-adenosine-specific RNA methylase IME4